MISSRAIGGRWPQSGRWLLHRDGVDFHALAARTGALPPDCRQAHQIRQAHFRGHRGTQVKLELGRVDRPAGGERHHQGQGRRQAEPPERGQHPAVTVVQLGETQRSRRTPLSGAKPMAWPEPAFLRLASALSKPHKSSLTPNRRSIVRLRIRAGMGGKRTASFLRMAAVLMEQFHTALGTGLQRKVRNTGMSGNFRYLMQAHRTSGEPPSPTAIPCHQGRLSRLHPNR